MIPKKIIVIGAGPGGLTSAMLLASKGYEVDVFEKQGFVGGRTSGFTLDEFTFDLGPTFLSMPYILEEIFELAGRKLEDYIELREIDPMYELIFSDLSFFPTRNQVEMKEQIEQLFPGNGEGISVL
ncbi:phytoene dehydrogenase [Halalkalibacter wakoensis JCM 9140]|uniref:Phytoene dehydrogenase n=1 Tax=Halalkalibacter wakoensis JCM 9140 TaxID=1236970 RepID=W4Q6X3_9BACI|nr:phytoene dehydrogenase [Halalkalibacter wakoensis JCM 9140]